MNPHDIFKPNDNKRGQWWHWVAALQDEEGNYYGIQNTLFLFAGIHFFQCALTDVSNKTFSRRQCCDRDLVGLYPIWKLTNFITENGQLVTTNWYYDGLEVKHYPSETSEHFGFPRVPVTGFINDKAVTGVGCFDREVFDRLLKPGETGWQWRIVWLDDGYTYMDYYHAGKAIRQMHWYSNHDRDADYHTIKSCGVNGLWPKTKYTPSYEESLMFIHDKAGKKIGTCFNEIVPEIDI